MECAMSTSPVVIPRPTSTGQKVGYIRVSSLDQNTARQLDGIELDHVFEDHASGKTANRQGLQAALKHVRAGDTLVVHSMDRMARSLDDLRRLVRELTARGVRVQFMKENLTFTGEDSPMSNLLLSMLGAVAEFERALIGERQREGIALAKIAGKYKGRKPSLSTEQQQTLKARAEAGENRSALAREYGISRQTLYTYLDGEQPA
jgi:DNA invertase Pin-like site-specific DNA recombinase